ncbi:metal-dependent hydrolase [Teredinibacter turnerae]|uniref:metal-dependent hydrolase n=1 Tax=Teredinibacter turnerae TaxID=2426 RepID=UPI0003668263|nr:metal-dependent hydrolase [Teredinibacter turnerae]
MANGKTHLAVGAAVGLTVALADQKKHKVSHHPGTGIALGALFGKLPDILEPSLGNPHHRQFCHSILVLTALGYGLKQMYDWHPEDGAQKCLRGLGLVAGCAYISHLLCDAATPRSLPVLGKLG